MAQDFLHIRVHHQKAKRFLELRVGLGQSLVIMNGRSDPEASDQSQAEAFSRAQCRSIDLSGSHALCCLVD